MLDFIIFAVTFLAVLLIAIIWLYPSSKTVTTIPGLPPSTKDDGNLTDLARAGSLHEFLMDLHSRFGPITGFWWGQTYVVSIASPEILKEHSGAFDRPLLLYKSHESLLGAKSIEFCNGSEGRRRRKTYDAIFSHDQMPKYMHYFEELAKRTEAKWLEKGEEDHIPLSEDAFVYAIQSALVSMMGENYKDEKQFVKFKNCYDKVFHEIENSLLDTSPMDEIRKENYDKALESLKKSIKDAISQRKKGDVHDEENLLVDILIDTCADEETVECDAITFLVGGFHTTGNLITWALYFLATHPDVQDKVCLEVQKVLGEGGSVDQHNLSQFVYLNQVIDETLRCAVVAPSAARFQEFDTELGGHKIPKNTPVIHALGVVMQDETLWPMPNKFDPDRFSPENRKTMSTYAFVPFGFAGKRKCPGYRFSNWNTVILLATLVRRFEISMWVDQVVTPVYGLVTHPEDEIWVKVKRRK